MYSVCTRIEMIIFNKRGKSLLNPFYKLPHNVSRAAALQRWLGLGTRQSLGRGDGGAGASGAGLQGLILGTPCSRWEMGTPLQHVCCGSHPVSQAETDAVSGALPGPQDPSGNVGSCKRVQQEQKAGSIHKDF